jgi:hypothetical protein
VEKVASVFGSSNVVSRLESHEAGVLRMQKEIAPGIVPIGITGSAISGPCVALKTQAERVAKGLDSAIDATTAGAAEAALATIIENASPKLSRAAPNTIKMLKQPFPNRPPQQKFVVIPATQSDTVTIIFGFPQRLHKLLLVKVPTARLGEPKMAEGAALFRPTPV